MTDDESSDNESRVNDIEMKEDEEGDAKNGRKNAATEEEEDDGDEEEDLGEDEYEIEKILEHRFAKGGVCSSPSSSPGASILVSGGKNQ